MPVEQIEIADLTTGVVGGTGVFDELMKSVGAHLLQEYKAKRITGSDYSRVYTSAMTTAMQQAIQFTLQKDISAYQAGLIQEQINQIIAQTLLTDEQRKEVTKRLEPNGLLDQQVLLAIAQVSQTDAQTALTNTQNTKTASENALVIKQTDKVESEIENLDQNLLKLVEDTNTAREQTQVVANTHAKLVSDKLLVDQNILNAQEQEELIRKQQNKTDQESGLLEYKQETENAQTTDLKLDGSTPVTGVVGKQKIVYDKQASGFDRDAEQKAATVYKDLNNIKLSTEQMVTPFEDAGIDDARSKTAMDKLLAGIDNPPPRNT